MDLKNSARPLAMNEMSKEQLDKAIAAGIDDIENGRVFISEQVDKFIEELTKEEACTDQI